MSTKGKKTVPVTDEKAAKFIELANSRVSKALTAIKAVGKLAGRKGSYNDEQVAKIRAALDGAVETMAERFETGAPEKSDFSLD